MSKKDDKPRLQIVPKASRRELAPQDFQASIEGSQTNLFPRPRPRMLVFVYFPDVTEDEFRKALEFSSPSAVFELRNTPRFDLGKLSRKAVFECFDRQHTKYVDIASSSRDNWNNSSLLEELANTFDRDLLRLDRPVMFLLNSHNLPPAFSQQIIDLVKSIKRTSLEVFSVPHHSRSTKRA